MRVRGYSPTNKVAFVIIYTIIGCNMRAINHPEIFLAYTEIMGLRFLFLIFLTGVWLIPAPAPAATEQGTAHYLPGPLSAEVIRVIDGDSIEVRVRIWLDQEIKTIVRLDGLDTAELKSRCAQERDMAGAAKARLNQLVSGQKLELYDIQRDKYGGRVIAKLRTPVEADIAKTLISENLARPYAGKKRGSWCERADAVH